MLRFVLSLIAVTAVVIAAPTLTTVAGPGSGFVNGIGSAARFGNPVHINGAGHPQGHMHIADRNNGAVRLFNKDTLEVSTRAAGVGSPTVIGPVDANGVLYFGEQAGHTVKRIAPNGVVTTVGTDYSNPYGITLHSDGYLYITALTYYCIFKTDPSSGARTVYAGGQGSYGYNGNNYRTAARYNNILNHGQTPNGDIYSAMYNSYAIIKIEFSSGYSSLFAGAVGSSGYADGAALSARFSSSYGVTVSCDGHVYVSDTGNSRIRRVYGGQVYTVAGNGVGSTVNGPALSASTNFPWGLTAHIAGLVYVIEYSGNAIRLLTEQPHSVSCSGESYCCAPVYAECAAIHASCTAMNLTPLQLACQADSALCGVYNLAVAVKNSCNRLGSDCDALIDGC